MPSAVDQVGKTAHPHLVKILEATLKAFYLLSKSVNGWAKDALAIDTESFLKVSDMAMLMRSLAC